MTKPQQHDAHVRLFDALTMRKYPSRIGNVLESKVHSGKRG